MSSSTYSSQLSRNSSLDSNNSSPYLDAPPPYTEHALPLKKKSIWKSFFSTPAAPYQHASAGNDKAQPSGLVPDMPAGIALYSSSKQKATRPKPLLTQDFGKDHYNPDAMLAMDMIRGTTVLMHQKRG